MTRLIRLVMITGEAWLSSRLILAGSRENLSGPSESIFLEERPGGSGIDRLSGSDVLPEGNVRRV